MNIIKSRIVYSVASTPSPQAGYMTFGGIYNFAINGGILPTAINKGTFYIAEDDYNSAGGEWIPAGSWFISKVDGASLFSEYSIKF